MLGRASLPSMSPPQASELSRKYRLDREVARGAYGVVYRATNKDIGDAVAVKVVVDKQGRCEGRELYFLKHVQGCEVRRWCRYLGMGCCGHEHGVQSVIAVVRQRFRTRDRNEIGEGVRHAPFGTPRFQHKR